MELKLFLPLPARRHRFGDMLSARAVQHRSTVRHPAATEKQGCGTYVTSESTIKLSSASASVSKTAQQTEKQTLLGIPSALQQDLIPTKLSG